MTNNNINNKDKQGEAGNWGHPRPYVKKHTNVSDRPEAGKHRGSAKYKKKEKKEYVYEWAMCPFCKSKLTIKEKHELDDIEWRRFHVFSDEYEHECKECGAHVIDEPCPACKQDRDMWINKDNVLKHHMYGCGFEGKKKYKKGD